MNSRKFDVLGYECMGTHGSVIVIYYVSSDNAIILSSQAKILVSQNQVLTWKKCK